MVTSIHNIQRMTKNGWKNWKQKGNCQKVQGSKEKEIKHDRWWWSWWVMMRLINWSCIMMKLTRKKAWGKRKEQVFRRGSWLIHHLENMSYQQMYTFYYYVVNGEVPSTSSQIVEQIEVIQEVVLRRISKLND